MSLEVLQGWLSSYGYFALFGSLVFGIVGLPIPDETLLTLSGFFVFKGQFSFVPTFLTAFSGSIAGISLSYAVGRFGGYRFLRRYGPRLRITEEKLQSVDLWYERVGKWMLTFGYFIPGIRHVMALVAGTSNMRYPVFAAFAYTGGVFWSLTFISLGYYLGNSWAEVRNHRLLLAAVAGGLIVLIFVIWYLKLKLGKRKVSVNRTEDTPRG